MRIPIIAGNWKMNNTIKEGLQLIEEIKQAKLNENVEAVVCVPFVGLLEIKKALEGTNIKLGAQNMHWEDSGAFTGEISPLMLKEIGVDYCIIGHSERRQYFGETSKSLNGKIKTALSEKLVVIYCVGETLSEREAGQTLSLVEDQLHQG